VQLAPVNEPKQWGNNSIRRATWAAEHWQLVAFVHLRTSARPEWAYNERPAFGKLLGDF